MTTLKASKLQEAFRRARDVGRAEETFTIDGRSVVLRNLTPKDYEAVMEEISELEEMEYLHAYQLGHVCRSLVEIEGVDLRDVEFIEEEVPDGAYLLQASVSNEAKATTAQKLLKEKGVVATLIPPTEGERTVTLERHEWLRRQLATWGREAISVAYRKFGEAVIEGERKAKEKIEFKTPDEAPEDKFRRVLGELKEVEVELPPDLLAKILDDAGYLQKTSQEELDTVANIAKTMAAEEKEPTPVPVPAPNPSPQAVVQRAAIPEPEQETVPEEVLARVRNRIPLNRQALSAPLPVQQNPVPVAAPEQLKRASRSDQIAALEGQADPELLSQIEEMAHLRPTEVAELSRPEPKMDPKALVTSIDQPPKAGINPRFRRAH